VVTPTPNPCLRALAASLHARAAVLLALAAWLALTAIPALGQTPGVPPVPRLPLQAAPAGSAFEGTGMWIWYVARSSGGNPDAIIAQATAANVKTVFIKSSDGGSWWPQFSPELVAALKAGGLRVCAWQYVYGTRPVVEARMGRQAIQSGADCLVIDAESQYEGKYWQAQRYMRKLRAYAGDSYPIGLAGFPYMDYHPAFPYSVFLGPGGAQFNVPQMYWKDIGTTVDGVYAHTYLYNPLYGRPIFPLGQLYNRPTKSQVVRFRTLAFGYGAAGTSWWDWQEALSSGWAGLRAVVSPLAAAGVELPPPPVFSRGARGDMIVWAQEHLTAAGVRTRANGVFDGTMKRRVVRFQTVAAMVPTGQLDAATWTALLSRPAAKVSWRRGVSAAAAGPNGPSSAHLPAVRDEIPQK